MMIKRVVLLPGSSYSQRVSSEGVQRISSREFMEFDRLGTELARLLDLEVVIQDGDGELGEEDFVIVTLDALEGILKRAHEPKALASRCLLVNVTRNLALEQAQGLGLAGVVDEAVYSQWQIHYPHAEVALFGLRALLPRIHGTVSPSPRETGPEYQRMVANAGSNLPRFIAEYIRALRQL